MSEIMGAFILLSMFVLLFVRKRNDTAAEPPEERTDFDYLSVREQIAAAKETADQVGDMEQLLTDLAESCEDDVIILHIEWVGRDDMQHEYDLYCGGLDTASECMTEIAEREVHDLREALAYQCAVLSERGRHRQNHRQNDFDAIGDEAYDQAVRAVRSSY